MITLTSVNHLIKPTMRPPFDHPIMCAPFNNPNMRALYCWNFGAPHGLKSRLVCPHDATNDTPLNIPINSAHACVLPSVAESKVSSIFYTRVSQRLGP